MSISRDVYFKFYFLLFGLYVSEKRATLYYISCCCCFQFFSVLLPVRSHWFSHCTWILITFVIHGNEINKVNNRKHAFAYIVVQRIPRWNVFCCGFSVPTQYHRCFIVFSSVLCSALLFFLNKSIIYASICECAFLFHVLGPGPGPEPECEWLRSISTVTAFSAVSFHKNVFFLLKTVCIESRTFNIIFCALLRLADFWSNSMPVVFFKYIFRFIRVAYQWSAASLLWMCY